MAKHCFINGGLVCLGRVLSNVLCILSLFNLIIMDIIGNANRRMKASEVRLDSRIRKLTEKERIL